MVKGKPDCSDCDARCCRYIAIELDRPRTKRDYDHLRWFLLHANVAVYIDHSRRWFLEFQTPCRALRPNRLCDAYAQRPDICRQHNAGDSVCERHEPEPCRVRFEHLRQLETYLDRRGIDWRYKRHAGPPRRPRQDNQLGKTGRLLLG